jgi:formate dehydrogenase major subunit
VAGDSANDLIALSGDPNVSIQESKAFRCDVRAGRRRGQTTEKLGGVGTPGEARAGSDSGEAEQPDHASRTDQSTHEEPGP